MTVSCIAKIEAKISCHNPSKSYACCIAQLYGREKYWQIECHLPMFCLAVHSYQLSFSLNLPNILPPILGGQSNIANIFPCPMIVGIFCRLLYS